VSPTRRPGRRSKPILVGYPSVELQDQAAYKKQVAGQIDKLLVFVIVLLLLAVVIALIGIVNTRPCRSSSAPGSSGSCGRSGWGAGR